MKEKTVCFSGHRPEKLPKDKQLISDIKSLIYYSICESINQGYTCFMSGLARGIDLWAALAVLELKQKKPDIKLIAVKPFQEHDKGFNESELSDLRKVISQADKVICTSPHYSKNVYAVRNKYMVEHSDKLIAFVNNYRSGTGQTIRFAQSLGLKINIIDLKELRENYQETLEKHQSFLYNI